MTAPSANGTDRLATGRPPLAFLALALVVVKLVAHVASNVWTPYEFHRDAFLYLAMGNHLRILHMDFPPLIALISQAVHAVAGTSLFAYRMVPMVAGVGVMLLAILIVRELGGGRTAQVLTAVVVLINPLFLRTANLFQPVVLDQLWWLLGIYAIARLANTDDPKWWLVLGAAGGLGLLTKFSILFFGFGVLVGLLCTAWRRTFLGPWPWVALGMALAIGSPSIIGQINLGYPLVEQMIGLQEGQLARVTFGEFIFGQFLFQPAGFVLALLGAGALLVHPALRAHRMLGWAALTVFFTFVVLHGKPYYYGPMHPLLIGAGAITVEQLTRDRARRAAVTVLAVAAMLYLPLAVPFGLPVVPPEPMAKFARAAGVTAAVRTNWGEVLPLPQDYADMLGWREQVEAVADVYHSLTPEEQAGTVLYGGNYGEAGALDFYGRALGLPPVVSLAGSFFHFGPGERPGDPLVLLGVEPGEITTIRCRSLELVKRVRNPWGVPEEQNTPIVICRGPSMTMQELWEAAARGEAD